jgi:outer membrane protein OmpA-like peptidoglycan-associated protein
VRELPDVVVPAVTVPPVPGPGGATLIEGFTIPAQVVDAGCVVTYDAPGGCLGAVRISAASIPPATIPESVLPASGSRSARTFAAVVVPGVEAPGASAPQACQVEESGELPAVTRRGVVRKGVARNGAARPGGDAGGVRVETVRLEPVRLPDVDIEPGRLESRKLKGRSDVDVLTGEGTVSYVAPGNVLFDTDESAIRPDAGAALRSIAAQIRAKTPNARLRVEGHTDDRGDETYGLRLSERRARSVADWLVKSAGFRADRITTKGFGETAPAVPNTSAANRQKNRRVVITVVGS